MGEKKGKWKPREQRALAPRIDDAAADAIERLFSSLNAGATYILESWPNLYRRELLEMRAQKLFNSAELHLILDALNGCFMVSGLVGQHVAAEVHDAIKLNRYDEKWDVDGDALIAKVAALTPWRGHVVEVWAGAFWQGEINDQAFEAEHLAQLVDPGSERNGGRTR